MQKFITKGVHENVPLQLQILMWELYDQMPGERDYLQVFEIKKTGNSLTMTHSQEIPEYNKTYVVPGAFSFVGKIFIIRDEDYETMLLASEY